MITLSIPASYRTWRSRAMARACCRLAGRNRRFMGVRMRPPISESARRSTRGNRPTRASLLSARKLAPASAHFGGLRSASSTLQDTSRTTIAPCSQIVAYPARAGRDQPRPFAHARLVIDRGPTRPTRAVTTKLTTRSPHSRHRPSQCPLESALRSTWQTS